MPYFNELPFIEYPLRFENQSSNEDYALVRNIFRRAKINERIANYATAFNYYQIRENQRPDEIAELVYGDPQLDWVILITNNIINLPSEWPLDNNAFYEYLLDKYNEEENFGTVKYLETSEVRDEYNRLVQPEKLQTDSNFYEEFTTISNKDNPLFYDLKFYPIPSTDYEINVTTTLGQYLEIWERNNLEENEEYTGPQYSVSEIFLKKSGDTSAYQLQDKLYPEYSRLDYSYLQVYGRNEEIKAIYNPITLNGWPNSWGGIVWVYNREGGRDRVLLKPNIGNPTDITNESRLYAISKIDKIDKITYTDGTILSSESNKTYTVKDLISSNDGLSAVFEVKRNSEGEIISVSIVDGGREYIVDETITILGSLIGGVNGKDDVQITVKQLSPKPGFKFISIGETNNIPYPGNKITIFNQNVLKYLNTRGEIISSYSNQNPVTNYEYELDINEKTRQILVLKPEYLGAFISEFRNIMYYDKSSETITNKLKRVYNPRITGQ